MEPRDLALTVWFDGDCGFCTRVAAWLRSQPKYVPLRVVAAQSATTQSCPLDVPSLLAKVTVTAAPGTSQPHTGLDKFCWSTMWLPKMAGSLISAWETADSNTVLRRRSAEVFFIGLGSTRGLEVREL